MLKIFRTFRKSIIKSGNFRRYSIYAVGEIALVVVGILIALQINNWNNNRIERKEEQSIYQRLIQDLEQDIKGMESSISNFEQRLIYGAEALRQLNSPNLSQVQSWSSYQKALENKSDLIETSNKSFGEILFRILIITLFYPTDNTFQELVASGKIDIIQDKDLKATIQAYYPEMKRRQNFQDNIIFTVQSNYRGSLRRNKISYLNKQSLEELTASGIDKSSFLIGHFFSTLEVKFDIGVACIQTPGLVNIVNSEPITVYQPDIHGSEGIPVNSLS